MTTEAVPNNPIMKLDITRDVGRSSKIEMHAKHLLAKDAYADNHRIICGSSMRLHKYPQW
jgi:hypothetical protein